MKRILFLLWLASTMSAAQTVTLIPASSSWKYLDNGSNQGTSWRSVSFNDASWASGNAELGYGDGGEATVVSYGPSSNNKYVTTYFRKAFNITSPSAYSGLTINLLRDDGAVVFINGTQVARSNMPTSFTYSTRASTSITGSGETTYYTYTALPSVLVTGNNVIAVEIHQFNRTNADISFNLSLTGNQTATCGVTASQNSSAITTTSAVISWAAVTGAVSYNLRYRRVGTSTYTTINTTNTTSNLSGLTQATQYEYSVQAVCSSLSGSFTTNSTFTTSTAIVCDTPGSLTSSSVTSTSATVSWSMVSGASSYNINYRQSGAPNWITVTSTTTSQSLSGLTAGTLYEFSVQAVCASGPGNFSANSTFTTSPAIVCDTPGSLSSSSVTATSATVSWNSVAGAVSYNINYRPSGSSNWTTVTSATTSQTLSGLNAGTLYEYAVQAVCSSGAGNFSATANFSTYISGNDSLVTTNANWKYLADGSNQGTAWKDPAFNDATWLSGNAELGYGDGDETTVVSYGPNSATKYVTTYFRKTFNVTNRAIYAALSLSVVRDDGIVVYLNGTEVYRNNMPTGTIAYNTLSPVAIGGTDESAWNSAVLNVSSLVTGNNVIAVEIHQQAITSTDISFRARLVAAGNAPLPTLTRGPYLQKVTPNSIVVRWRTNTACNSHVKFGTTTAYSSSASDATITTEHIVTVSGLTAATKYYYTIGTTSDILQGDTKNNFTTSPVTGSITPVRVWVTGDFGNGSAQQTAVKNSYASYAASNPANFWIWLGDNAYSTGTDAEYQSNVFNMYPEQFKNIPLYPSPGNHDYANAGYQGTSALTTNFPYFTTFTVPQAGEAGGVASNTPKYYSYNYGNIHFISLDSYGAFNNTTSPMYQWLNNDLAANAQRWIVVYFHHPPYTQGSHNSDNNTELVNMRSNIIPLLESYHVDLVLCGHSHINERSYLIKGHFGLASSFTSAMKINTSGTTMNKTPPYDGTVYAVCGTSGQSPGATQAGWPMPCMYYSNNSLNCSMIIDVNGDVLTSNYLSSGGAIVDQFTMTKTGARESIQSTPETVNVRYEPAEKQIVVDYYLEKDAVVDVSIYAISGQAIQQPGNGKQTLAAGFYRDFLDVPQLASGAYFVKVNVNNKAYNSKIVIP